MSVYKRSRFTVLTAPYLHHTLAYGLDSIAANGFRGVELWGASPHYCLDDYDKAGRHARIHEINAMLAERGLAMDVYHPEQIRQYPINIASPDPYLRNKSLHYMRRCLEDAAAFGAELMMLTPGWAFVDSFCDDDTGRAIESIGMLAEYAATLHVRLAMEEQEPIVSLLCSDLDKLSAIVKATGIEACMDMTLSLARGGSVDGYFDTFGKLGHVHLSDAGNSGCAALGAGALDITGLLAQLDEHGYEGKISLAFWGAIHYPDPDTPLWESRAWLMQHGIR